MSALTLRMSSLSAGRTNRFHNLSIAQVGLVVPLQPIVGALAVQRGRVLGPVGKSGTEQPIGHKQLVFQTEVRICEERWNQMQSAEQRNAG